MRTAKGALHCVHVPHLTVQTAVDMSQSDLQVERERAHFYF